MNQDISQLAIAFESSSVRAIEDDFPVEELHKVAEIESFRKEVYRPVYHIHKWWAKRLGSVFRTIVLSGLCRRGEDVWEKFYQKYDGFEGLVVLDPFMGSGTTIGESIKLGCKAVGSDINPVAFFASKTALELRDYGKLKEGFKRVEKAAKPQFERFYKSSYQGVECDVLYTFWVMKAPCLECGHETPLHKKWIFSSNAYPKKKPQSKAICPGCGDIVDVNYHDDFAVCRSCDTEFNPQAGNAKQAGRDFECESCGKVQSVKKAVASRPGKPLYEPYALMLLTPEGKKVYKKPSKADVDLYFEAEGLLDKLELPLPDGAIISGHNTNQAIGYNFKNWKELFNSRQLLTLGIILQEILQETEAEVREPLLALFSGTLEFNNMFCSFKGEGTGAVRHMFYHHILKPEKTPLEANPWGTPKSSGSFSTLFKRRLTSAFQYAADPFEIKATECEGKLKGDRVYGINKPMQPRLAKDFGEIQSDDADVLLLSMDSSNLPLPDNSVDLVATDPPYFDMVHYSELADFFYAWLKHGMLGQSFSGATTRNEKEVQQKEVSKFQSLLSGVFCECRRVMKDNALLTFTFHHSKGEAWDAIAHAIKDAGLFVVATHPVKAEMSVSVPKHKTKEPINLDLVIVAAKHPRELVDGFGVQNFVELAIQKKKRFMNSGMKISRGDVRVILMGEYMKVFCHMSVGDNWGVYSAQELMDEFESQIETVYHA